jgi:uncharacterized protein with von Willebrand factor type A (vWA) domain
MGIKPTPSIENLVQAKAAAEDTVKMAQALRTATTVQKDAFDDLMFDGMQESPMFKNLTNSCPGPVQDVFNAMYKLDPKVAAEATAPQKNLLESLMKLPEYESLHTTTKMDSVSSALGTMKMAPEILKQLSAMVKKEQERQKQMEEEAKKAPGKKDAQGNPVDSGDQPGQGSGDQASQDAGEQAAMRQALREAAEKAQEAAEQWQETALHWGIKSGELERIPVGKRMELAQRLMSTKKFQDVADLAGRFKNMVNAAQAVSPTHGYDEIVDITQGSDISRMLPTEALKFFKTRKLFIKDLAEGKLLQYEMKGVEQMGRGPLIVCLDVSVSMQQGGADEWSKAVTLALMGLAEKQKRSFGFILFDSKVKKGTIWPKENPPTIENKLEIAELVSRGGGTNFYVPLMNAFQMRNKHGDLKPADIVFITDGEYRFQDSELEEILQAKQDVRIFGIQVGSSNYSAEMEKFCDHIVAVQDGNIEAVKDVINKTSQDVKRKEADL